MKQAKPLLTAIGAITICIILVSFSLVLNRRPSALAAHAGAIAGGTGHSLWLRDGVVWVWGSNWKGGLGVGKTESTPGNRFPDISMIQKTPKQIEGLTDVAGVAAGLQYSLVLKIDGTVWAWGSNAYGVLGDGSYNDRTVPTQIAGLSHIKSIAGGFTHCLAIDEEGALWTWGFSDDGGTLEEVMADTPLRPVRVGSMSGFVAVAAGQFRSLALKQDGTVWEWGSQRISSGERNGKRNPEPALVDGLADVKAIAVSSAKLAVKSDGTVWAWGPNHSGQIGDGTTTGRATPVRVPALSEVVAVAAGGAHSLALKRDGSVWAWGANSRGQLGDGTTASRLTPIQVPQLTDVTAIACGARHNLALTRDGTLWTWGSNSQGQLGDGTTTDRLSPVQVQIIL